MVTGDTVLTDDSLLARPEGLGIVPLYVEARNLGLTGSPWGMIVIYTGVLMPLSVFLYGGFFRRLPRDYEEAATVDGASRGKVFVRIVFPLMGPATGTVALPRPAGAAHCGQVPALAR